MTQRPARGRFVPAMEFSSQDSFGWWDSARGFTGCLGMSRQINPRANARARSRKAKPEVNVVKKLQHPLALVTQGFILGGVLFWTTQGQATQQAAAPAPTAATVSAD